MAPDLLRNVVLATLGASAALWIVASFVTRIAGTWERVLTDDEIEEGQRPERMELAQLGPFVTGRRDVTGGHQEFSGYLLGRSLRMVRRDHGVDSLTALGFPEGIAKQLDGEVTARLKLRIVEGVYLEGVFIPQKVEFTHRPPKVTKAYYLEPQPRRYRRVVPIPVEDDARRLVEDRAVDVEPA